MGEFTGMFIPSRHGMLSCYQQRSGDVSRRNVDLATLIWTLSKFKKKCGVTIKNRDSTPRNRDENDRVQ
jgi:hypothetical protein